MNQDTCSVPSCLRPRRTRGWCQSHYARVLRWGDPLAGQPQRTKFDSHQDRFWAKVDKSAGPDACWPWIASRGTGGYGQFRWDEMGTGAPLIASRVALFFASGKWPDVALHRCDNPPCCNPAHLRDSTQRENLDDAHRKGRLAACVMKRPSPLTDEEVIAIRAAVSAGASQASVGRKHQINQSTVSLIVNRKTWKHV